VRQALLISFLRAHQICAPAIKKFYNTIKKFNSSDYNLLSILLNKFPDYLFYHSNLILAANYI
jgi:hypothetical protein